MRKWTNTLKKNISFYVCFPVLIRQWI